MAERHVDDLTYRFGEFELSPRDRLLTRSGEKVSLTPRMFDLLRTLVEADGHLLRKEILLDSVWSDAAVEEGNLNRTISALRKALGEKRDEIRYIETVPKAGYRFVADVERLNGGAGVSEFAGRQITNSDAASTSAGGVDGESPAVVPSRGGRAGWIIAGSIAVLVAAVLGTYYLLGPRDPAAGAAKVLGPARLTNNEFDEDGAAWTSDDKIRFIRFTAVNKVESMIMNADGSGQARAGVEIRDLRAGTWSPDGKRVIYSKYGAPPRAAFVANADGTDERMLGFPIGPMDWSPDGTRIVYSTGYPTETDDSEIVVYSFETGERRNISDHPAFDANPSFSPDGKQIIFNSDRDGNSEVYLMNADGTGLRRLTNDPAKEAFQAFSPDGTQIVFNSNRENEKVGIYLLNVNDNSPPVRLSDTRHNAEIRPGCWSRDGTRIVYMSDAGGDKFNLYSTKVEPASPVLVFKDDRTDVQSVAISPDGVRAAMSVKIDGGRGELRVLEMGSRRVQTVLTTENFDLAPNWSPDGKRIAFANKAEGNTEVFSVNADGSDLKNLTQNAARDAGPAWSPDGGSIIFSTDRDDRSESTQLYLMNADGSDPRRVMRRRGYELTPAWSSDGRWIAFAGDRIDGSSQALDIYITDVSNVDAERMVTSRRFHDANPVFSPDGKRIAFASQSDGNFEIYLVNVDGSGLVRLTRDSGDDIMPVFSPDGRKIYFVSDREGNLALFEMKVN